MPTSRFKEAADRRRLLTVVLIVIFSAICEGRRGAENNRSFQIKSFAGKAPSDRQSNASPFPRFNPILQSESLRRILSQLEGSRASTDSRGSKSGKASKTSKTS